MNIEAMRKGIEKRAVALCAMCAGRFNCANCSIKINLPNGEPVGKKG